VINKIALNKAVNFFIWYKFRFFLRVAVLLNSEIETPPSEINLLRPLVNILQIPAHFLVIKAVAHHKFIFNFETHIF